MGRGRVMRIGWREIGERLGREGGLKRPRSNRRMVRISRVQTRKSGRENMEIDGESLKNRGKSQAFLYVQEHSNYYREIPSILLYAFWTLIIFPPKLLRQWRCEAGFGVTLSPKFGAVGGESLSLVQL